MADQEDKVAITLNPTKSQVLFRLKNKEINVDIELVSQLVQGTFPNYAQLIPKSYNTRVIVGKDEFLRATKTASIFARDGSGIVRLVVTPGGAATPGKVAVSARSDEIGDDGGGNDA